MEIEPVEPPPFNVTEAPEAYCLRYACICGWKTDYSGYCLKWRGRNKR